MNRRANPAVIGAFVVGAIVLIVIAVVVFGSGRLFRTTYEYILYFPGNVNGLKVGAPVKLKGIEIGSVKHILLHAGKITAMDSSVEDVRIPVIIELEAEQAAELGAKRRPDPPTIKQLVDRGLRARLASESFVTGLLYVSFDFLPDKPMQLMADPSVPYPEIPTLPTPLEEVQMKAAKFLSQLDEFDVKGLVGSLSATVDGLNRLVNSPRLAETVDSLPATANKIDQALTELSATLVSVRQLSAEMNAKLEPAVGSLEATADRAGETLQAATKTLAQVEAVLKPGSPILYELRKSLNDLSGAARAMRRFAEDLERNPSVLLRGEATEEANQ